MKAAKAIAGAFVVGGAYGLIGQLLFAGYSALLGADSPFVMFGVLVTLGVLALVLYVSGLHQKIASVGGYGSVLPFNGFACGVADAYEAGRAEGHGLKSAIMLVLSVMGAGALINAIIAAFVAFM